MKTLLPLAGLLLSTLAAQSAPPAALPVFPEAAKFRELDDQLYPLGWSQDGNRLAILTEHFNEAADEQRWTMEVRDLKTDEAVKELEFRVPHGTPIDGFWKEYGANIESALAEQKIERASFTFQHFPGLAGEMRSEVLEISVESEHGEEPNFQYTGVRSVEVKLSRSVRPTSSATESKVVFRKTWEQFYPLAIGVAGYLPSPSGNRIAIVAVSTTRGWEGPPHVRGLFVIGAGIGDLF